jgi:tetratricopeptide (TPR) repeat protein
MNRSLIFLSCSIVLLASPIFSSAEGRNSGGASVAKLSSAVISIRELQIPEKAREACNEGTKRFIAQDYAGSIPEFQRAIKIFPTYYEAYAKIGASEMQMEHWDNAEAAFRKSMELSAGQYATADFGLALILTTVTRQYSEAEPIVRAGLELNPTDVTGRFVLGWLLYATSRLPEAEQAAREAATSDPTFAGARLLLAQIHLDEKNPAAVVQDLDAYLALGVSNPLDAQVRAFRARAQHELDAADANVVAIQVK